MIAMVFLDETLNALEWMGLVLTIVGVAAVIFFRGKGPIIPTAARFVFWGVVFAILSACCQGIAVVIQRHGMQSIHVLYGTMIRIAPAILVLILINARGSSWKQLHLIWQHKSKRIYLTAASFMGTCLGLTCLSLGTKYSKAGIAAALTSTYPIWIIPVAYFLLGEKTSPKSIGATFVAVAGIVLMTVG
jgi:drug/metabolite transporter (DMT)-like permease